MIRLTKYPLMQFFCISRLVAMGAMKEILSNRRENPLPSQNGLGGDSAIGYVQI